MPSSLGAPDILLALIAVVATTVSLVAWVVKYSERRAGLIVDRFIGHLEERVKSDAEAFRTLSSAIQSNTLAIEELKKAIGEIRSAGGRRS